MLGFGREKAGYAIRPTREDGEEEKDRREDELAAEEEQDARERSVLVVVESKETILSEM